MYKCGINTYFIQQTGSEELHVVTLYWAKTQNGYKLTIIAVTVLMDELLGNIPTTNNSYGPTPHSMNLHNDKVESLTFSRYTEWSPIKYRPFLSKRENTVLKWAFKLTALRCSRNVAFKRRYVMGNTQSIRFSRWSLQCDIMVCVNSLLKHACSI